MDISTSISSQHLHPGIRAWHALEHSHKQAWRGLATKLRRPPHEGLLERRSYRPRPRFCTQWASYDRHEKLQRARCPRAHARGARPRGIASRPSSASRAGSGRGLRQNQPKNAPVRPSEHAPGSIDFFRSPVGVAHPVVAGRWGRWYGSGRRARCARRGTPFRTHHPHARGYQRQTRE